MPVRVWFNKGFSVLQGLLDYVKAEDAGRRFHLVASHPVEHAMPRLSADEWHIEPDLSGTAYVDWCLHFCKEQGIDLFVPARAAIDIADREAEFIAQGTQLLRVAKPEILRMLEDKGRFTLLLNETITPAPDTREVRNLAEFRVACEDLGQHHGTLCIKPSVSVFGLGFRVLDDHHSTLHHILKGQDHRVNRMELERSMEQAPAFKPALLVMEYLGGDEWSVDCVARDGHLIYAVQRRKSHRSSAPQIIDDNATISLMTRDLTRRFSLSGMFNIQFREGEHGVRVLEINARPSGGSPVSCAAGPNLPYAALRLAIEPEWTPPLVEACVGGLAHQTMVPRLIACNSANP